MGVYGSPQIGFFAEEHKEKKKLSNPVLIIFDAITLLFCCFFIEGLVLLDYPNLFAVSFLVVFGLVIGLTVGLFKRIRQCISNRMLLLFWSGTILITLGIALMLG